MSVMPFAQRARFNLSEISPSFFFFFFFFFGLFSLYIFPIWFAIVHYYYYWTFHVDAHGKRVKEINLKNCMLSNNFNIHNNMDIKKNHINLSFHIYVVG
jgi:predicted membrane protein